VVGCTSVHQWVAGKMRVSIMVAQVERILGPAEAVNQSNEGSITVVERRYTTEERQQVTARFVGGI
jgi:hypothetical protein